MESRVLERMVGSGEPEDHKGPIVTFLIFIFIVLRFSPCTCVPCLCLGLWRSEKGVRPLKLELQIDLSGHVGAGN